MAHCAVSTAAIQVRRKVGTGLPTGTGRSSRVKTPGTPRVRETDPIATNGRNRRLSGASRIISVSCQSARTVLHTNLNVLNVREPRSRPEV